MKYAPFLFFLVQKKKNSIFNKKKNEKVIIENNRLTQSFSRYTIFDIKEEKLKGHYIGRQYIISEKELKEFINTLGVKQI